MILHFEPSQRGKQIKVDGQDVTLTGYYYQDQAGTWWQKSGGGYVLGPAPQIVNE